MNKYFSGVRDRISSFLGFTVRSFWAMHFVAAAKRRREGLFFMLVIDSFTLSSPWTFSRFNSSSAYSSFRWTLRTVFESQTLVRNVYTLLYYKTDGSMIASPFSSFGPNLQHIRDLEYHESSISINKDNKPLAESLVQLCRSLHQIDYYLSFGQPKFLTRLVQVNPGYKGSASRAVRPKGSSSRTFLNS